MENSNVVNERLTWVDRSGSKILVADYRGLDEEPLLRQIEKNEADFLAAGKRLGEKSLLIMSDVREILFSEKVMYRYRELGHAVEPYILASAIVGISGLRRPVFDLYNKLMTLKRRAFADTDKALEWLASQRNG